jgi:hypothetical protein
MLTEFVLDKTDSIDIIKIAKEYKDHKHADIIFKAVVRFSKNGDSGPRTFSIKLIALRVCLDTSDVVTDSNEIDSIEI